MTDRSTAETVTIIGAGTGGLYLLAALGVAGFKLRLHDIDDSTLSEIRAHGGVDVEGESVGFAAVDRATTDLPSAVEGADVIIVVTGGNSQAAVARSLAPLVRDGQVILLIQGNTGGSLIARRALDDAGSRAEVKPDGGAVVTVMDFGEPFPLDPLPSGWGHRKFWTRSPMTMSFGVKDGVSSMRFATDSASMLFRHVDIDLAAYPMLAWRWYIELPISSPLDERTREGDDHPA